MHLAKIGKFVVALLLACFVDEHVCAGSDAPRFEDYRVVAWFSAENHDLDISVRTEGKWMMYRSSAIKRKVNFAGHYIVFTGDCGAGAVCGEVLDAKTGKVAAAFPNAYLLEGGGGDCFDVGFRPQSRLLVISGVAADPEVDQKGRLLPMKNRVRYFEMKSGRLVLIKIEQN